MRAVLSFFGFLGFFCAWGSGPAAVYRINSAYEISASGSGKWDITEEIKTRIEILESREGQTFLFSFYEPYYAEKMKVKGWANGSSLESNQYYSRPADFGDSFMSDSKVHFIGFSEEQSKKGKTIEWQTSYSFKDLVFFPVISVPEEDSVSGYTITIEHPESLYVDFDFIFTGDSVGYELGREKEKTTLRFHSFSGLKESRSYYPFSSTRVYVYPKLTIRKKPVNGFTPESFASWYLRSFENRPALNLQGKALADSLTKDLADPAEKVKKLFLWVQKSIRYLADGSSGHSIIPHDAHYVLKKKYGDCKDRAFLIRDLAGYLGIKVYPVLVSTDAVAQKELIYVENFNHVINAIKTDQGYLYFDPTDQTGEFGHVSSNLLLSKALVLDPEKPELTQIPFGSGILEAEIEISAHEDSLSAATGTVKFSRGFLTYIRYAKKDKNSFDLENLVNDILSSFVQNTGFSSIDELPSDQGESRFRFHADLAKSVIKSPTKLYLPKIPFLLMTNSLIEREKDYHPVFASFPSRLSLRLSLKGKQRTSAATPFELKGEGVSYTSSLTQTGDLFNLNCEWKSDRFIYEGSPKAAFLKFSKDWLKNKNQLFTITGAQPK